MSANIPQKTLKTILAVLAIAVGVLSAATLCAQGFTVNEGRRLIEEQEFEQARDVLLKAVEDQPEDAEDES